MYIVEPIVDAANVERLWEGSIMSLKNRIERSTTKLKERMTKGFGKLGGRIDEIEENQKELMLHIKKIPYDVMTLMQKQNQPGGLT